MPVFTSKWNLDQHQLHDDTRPLLLLVAKQLIGVLLLNYQQHPYHLRSLPLPNNPPHLSMTSQNNPYPLSMPSIQHVVNVLSPVHLIGGKLMSLPMSYFVIVVIGAIVQALYHEFNPIMSLPTQYTKSICNSLIITHPMYVVIFSFHL